MGRYSSINTGTDRTPSSAIWDALLACRRESRLTFLLPSLLLAFWSLAAAIRHVALHYVAKFVHGVKWLLTPERSKSKRSPRLRFDYEQGVWHSHSSCCHDPDEVQVPRSLIWLEYVSIHYAS